MSYTEKKLVSQWHRFLFILLYFGSDTHASLPFYTFIFRKRYTRIASFLYFYNSEAIHTHRFLFILLYFGSDTHASLPFYTFIFRKRYRRCAASPWETKSVRISRKRKIRRFG